MLNIVKPQPDCKGLLVRYTCSVFVTLAGGVRAEQEIYPLKRLSCTGCVQCGGIAEALHEDPQGVEFDPALADGDTGRLSVVVGSRDPESGHANDWHVRVVRVAP